METEVEVTLKDWVTCPKCGSEQEVIITRDIMVEVEPEEAK